MPRRAAGRARTATSGDPCGFPSRTGRRPPSAPLNGPDPWRPRAVPRSPHAPILVSGDGRVNYARRQQYRRLSPAGPAAAGAAAVAMLGLWLASMGVTSIAGLLLLLAIGLGLYARHWLVLAGRSRVGARSEDEVQRALARLETEGWRLRHSLPWRGRGDIDSVAIPPPAWPSRSRPRPRPTRTDTLLRCANRRHGYRVAGGDGASAVRCRSCALLDVAGWSLSRPECWWCRSTGLRRLSVRQPACAIVRASCGEIARLPGLR